MPRVCVCGSFLGFPFNVPSQASCACDWVLSVGLPVGSIVINYASRAAMLFQGVPAAWFITQDEKAQRGEDRNQESGDDDGEQPEQPGQKRSYPPPNPTPRSSIRLALKRVKTEPSHEG